jgi:hypothetical protein
MKTKLAALLTVLAVLTLGRSAAAQIFDLNSDWSEISNPNGVWTYRAGDDLMTFDSPPITNPGGIPAWVGPDGYLPIWFKYAGADYFDMHTGDVIAHSANDDAEGVFNILWTAPSAGTIDMTGAAWFAAEEGSQAGRSSVWSLWLNGSLLTGGEVASGDAYDRSSPFHFALGSGGAGVLQNVTVAAGDQVKLQVRKETGPHGTFVGLNWTVALTAFTNAAPIARHHYTFDGPGVIDSVGTADGTLFNGAAIISGSLMVDGVDDFVQFDEFLIPSSGNFSLTFFAQQLSPQSSYTEIISQGFSGAGFYVGHDPNRNIRAGDAWISTGIPYPSDGLMHHFALTVGASQTRFYIDGSLAGTFGPISFSSSSGTATRLGKQFEPYGEFFHGLVDELWVFDGTLAECEVRFLSENSGRALPPNGLDADACNCVPVPTGAIAWWRAEGNALDSVDGKHGALQNGAGFAPGKVGHAFSLNGANQYVLIGDPVPPALQIQNEITLSAWIHVTAYPGSGDLGLIIGSQYDAGGAGATIFLDGRANPDGQPSPPGHIHFQIGDGASWHTANANAQVPLNQWVHIVATRKANEDAKIYYNGVLQPATSVPWSGAISYNGAWFAIGQQKDLNRPFNGLIDEADVYNRALTAAEIESIYAAGAAGKCATDCPPIVSGLTSWWQGEGNASDVLGANNGSLLGGTSFTPAVVGSGFTFDSNDDGVTIPHHTSLDVSGPGFSVEFWMKGTRSQPERYIVVIDKSHGSVDTSGWAFQCDSTTGQMIFSIGQTTGGFASAYSTTDVLDDRFHYIAGTWESGMLRLYVDGMLQTSLPITQPANNNRAVNMGFWWGGGTTAQFFRGVLDEPKLYHRTLSAQEIAGIYNCQSACQAPFIVNQPVNQSACSGAMVTFTAVASGTAPLTYQWSKDGSDIPGATSSVLILNSVTAADGGGYRVRVENACGVAESSVAVLAVEVSQCVPMPMGVVASWKADGNTEDSVGILAGSIVGGVTFAPGRVAQAFSLDGIGGQIQVPHSCAISYGPNTPMTVELWVYRNSPGPVQHILGKRDVDGGPMNYQLAFDGSHISWGNFAGAAAAAGTLPMNTWTHLAGSFDGGMFKIYVNGVLAGTGPGVMGPETTAPLTFGTSGQHEPFGGLLDEVTFYNRALDDAEIAAIYAAGCAGKCSQNCFAPVVARPPSNQTICLAGTATFIVCAAGRGPFSHQWRHQGIEIPGATAATLTISPVLSAHAGSYTVRIQNACGEIISSPAILNVLDAPPAITLNGPATVVLEACTAAYLEPGATAVDDCDGTLPVVIGGDMVNVNLPGTYVITYSATDASGQTATVTRTVTVQDTTPPSLTLAGANPQTIECHGSYSELGATATDACAGNLTGAIVINASAVNINEAGTYTVSYSVSDGFNTTTATRTVIVQDTTAPSLTLNGVNPMTVECHGTFTDPGATASDACAGDLSSQIVATGTVDANTPGSYAVTYAISDAQGNVAASVVRTVNVVDTTPPSLTLTGNNPQTIECHGSYTELGAMATDACAGNLTGAIVINASAVNVNEAGTYTVSYSVSDGFNTTTATRTVIVQDTTAPSLTLNGVNPMTVECHGTFTDPGATASDACAGDLSGQIVATGTVDVNTPGSYTVTYAISDAQGNVAASVVRTVNVVDTTPPSLTLAGANPQTIECHGSYSELGATATDACAGNLTGAIVIVASAVNANQAGTYIVTYSVSDGLHTTTATRTVIVADTTAPSLTLNGPNPLTVECHGTFIDPGATASDACAGDLSSQIVVSSTVDVNTPGSYTVTYTLSDPQGNVAAAVVRTVNVVDTTPPSLSLAGANPQTIECHGSYIELGATATDACAGNLTGAIVIDASAVNANQAGTYIVTYSVSDGLHTTTATRTVIVADTTAPSLLCPPNIVVNAAPGGCDAVVTYLVTATDNCSAVNVLCMPPSGSHFQKGTTLVSCSATDASGHTSTCSFTVTVNAPPSADPQSVITGEDTPVAITLTGSHCAGDVTAFTISNGPVHGTLTGTAPNLTYTPGLNYTGADSFTFEVSDGHGGTASAVVSITVTAGSANPPTLACPANVTVGITSICGNTAPATNAAIAAFLSGATASGGCAPVTITHNAPASFPPGTSTVTFTATDACGQATTCQANVIVVSQPVNCDSIQTEIEHARVYFDRNGHSEFALFQGEVTFTGGDLAPDFRVVPGQAAHGSLRVTVCGSVIYCNPDIPFTVHDANDPANDREKWHYNAGPKEKVMFRWKETQEFKAVNDPNLPKSAATGYKHVGKLSTTFIHTEETRYRYQFKDADLPLEIRINGVKLLSVNAANQVSTAYPYWKNGKMVEVLFPARLEPGDVIVYDHDSNGGNGVIYTQSVSADGNCTDEYFNAGGQFFFKVPVTGLNLNCPSREARVEFTIGQPGATVVGCGTDAITVNRQAGHSHKFSRHGGDPDEDECENEVENDD